MTRSGNALALRLAEVGRGEAAEERAGAAAGDADVARAVEQEQLHLAAEGEQLAELRAVNAFTPNVVSPSTCRSCGRPWLFEFAYVRMVAYPSRKGRGVALSAKNAPTWLAESSFASVRT